MKKKLFCGQTWGISESLVNTSVADVLVTQRAIRLELQNECSLKQIQHDKG